jgi:hypothetical protein
MFCTRRKKINLSEGAGSESRIAVKKYCETPIRYVGIYWSKAVAFAIRHRRRDPHPPFSRTKIYTTYVVDSGVCLSTFLRRAHRPGTRGRSLHFAFVGNGEGRREGGRRGRGIVDTPPPPRRTIRWVEGGKERPRHIAGHPHFSSTLPSRSSCSFSLTYSSSSSLAL